MSESRTPYYDVERQLGRGGMGVVYQAFDKKHGRHVALKTLSNETSAETLELFRQELALLSQISHPNIVDVYDSGELEEDGRRKPYFVMPLLRGRTLQELIESSSEPLPVDRVVDILIQAARGLHAAHERGLIHRDLKPSNIFILEDYSVNLIDFGVAHLVDRNATMGLRGTLRYMAPEQLSRKPLTASVDIFALGLVGWEALATRNPFDGATETDIVDAILHRVPPLLTETNPAVGRAISLVIHKAMAKHPAHRFATAQDMAECLQKAVRNEPIEYFNPERVQPRLAKARAALAGGDLEYAREILAGCEAEGFVSPDLAELRRTIEDEARRKTVGRLLEAAERRFRDEEYLIASQKIEELLELDPGHASGIELKKRIEEGKASPSAAPPVQEPKASSPPVPAAAEKEPAPVRSAKKPYVPHRRRRSPVLRFVPSKRVLAMVGASLAVVLGIAAVAHFQSGNSAQLTIEPSGAVVQIDGRQVEPPFNLRHGSYHVAARLPGYQPVDANVNVEPGGPTAIVLRLPPLPPVVRITADFAGGTVSLDRILVEPLSGGRHVLTQLQTGIHWITVSRPDLGQATVRFRILQGQPPIIMSGPTARGVDAVAVSAFRGRGRLLATLPNSSVRVDGKPVGGLYAGMLEMLEIQPGTREFSFGEGTKLTAEIGEEPSLFLGVITQGDSRRRTAPGAPVLPSISGLPPRPGAALGQTGAGSARP
ncbi:MAG: protein kinase [Bryobacteraceae bacterium]|nr:protein kinase [Bryobacteraceae bacterium]